MVLSAFSHKNQQQDPQQESQAAPPCSQSGKGAWEISARKADASLIRTHDKILWAGSFLLVLQ
jgi:hypothetical protein